MHQRTPAIPTVLRTLRRRIGIVVLCCVLVPATVLAFSLSQQKEYTASASLLFRDPGFDQKLFGSQAFAPSSDPAREAATNLELVSLDVVAKRTSQLVPKAGAVKSHVDVEPAGESNVVQVSATYPDRRLAARVANTFAQRYIALRQDADRAKIAQAQALVKTRLKETSGRQGSRERSLQERLEILSSLQTGNAELAQGATVPSNPSSPRIVQNTIFGAIFGLLLGVGLAFLFERLDRRLRDPKEIEEMFERPILAAIPESRTLARSGLVQEVMPAAEGESFRMLRANLRYFNVDHAVKSVLVTSAAPGDGKSTVAWNLASSAAGAGAKVLLVEADLRHPGLADSLAMRGSPGLSTVLSAEATLNDVIQQVPVQAKASGLGVETVDVLLAGPLPPNPAELLESNRMRELIKSAERSYDLLVIDTPPTSVVSDAIPLLSQVGGVIVVARLKKTTREAAGHLRSQLRNLDARILGLVVNAVGRDGDTYGYAYGYGAGYGDGADGSGSATTPPEPEASPETVEPVERTGHR